MKNPYGPSGRAVADRLGIDLQAAFTRTMDELDQQLSP
jgi:hypothetical protein